MLHKDYNRKCSVEKSLIVKLEGLDAKMNWLAVNRQSWSDSGFELVESVESSE
jgi:hypothetical protein